MKVLVPMFLIPNDNLQEEVVSYLKDKGAETVPCQSFKEAIRCMATYWEGEKPADLCLQVTADCDTTAIYSLAGMCGLGLIILPTELSSKIYAARRQREVCMSAVPY